MIRALRRPSAVLQGRLVGSSGAALTQGELEELAQSADRQQRQPPAQNGQGSAGTGGEALAGAAAPKGAAAAP